MKRTTVVRAAALIAPVAVILVLTELGLRWLARSAGGGELHEEIVTSGIERVHRKSSDPALVYELVPLAESLHEGVNLRINGAGFRDDEFPADPGDRARIVVLGDSVAFGLGVPMSRAFPQRLERLLSPNGDGPLVFNLAVSGYSTGQELRLLETRGLSLAPDLVLLSYVLNDPDPVYAGLSRFYQTSFELPQAIRMALRFARTARAGHSIPEDHYQLIHLLYRDETREQFRRLGRIGDESGVPILVAVTPLFDFAPDAEYGWQNLHDEIAALCAANGLAFLDLGPSFAGRRSDGFALDLWHPNAAGHAVIAEALAEVVPPLLRR